MRRLLTFFLVLLISPVSSLAQYDTGAGMPEPFFKAPKSPNNATSTSSAAATASASSSSSATITPLLSLPSENLPIVSARPLNAIQGIMIGDRVQFEVENLKIEGRYRSFKLMPESVNLTWAKVGIQPTDTITLNNGTLRFSISPLKDGSVGPLRVKLTGVDPDASLIWIELPAMDVLGLEKSQEPPPALLEPRDLPFPWTALLLWAALIVPIIGASFFYIIRYLRRKLKKDSTKPKKPEDIVALRKLDRLAKADYLARKAYKVYYFELSDLFKEYLDRRYEIKAVESTSSELLTLLKTKVQDPELLKAVEFTFERLDFVKFTDHDPATQEPETLHALVRNWVTKTRRTPNAV